MPIVGPGGGSQSVKKMGPYTVNVGDGQGIVLWHAKAGDLIWELVVITTVTWDGGRVEIYCDAVDFVFPGSGSPMTVTGDSTRFTTSILFDSLLNASANITPSLMRVNADVICDVVTPGATGQVKIFALVSPV